MERFKHEKMDIAIWQKGNKMSRLPRYIDATKLEELCEIMGDKCDDGSGESLWNQFKTVVECSPTADVVERKNGEWISKETLFDDLNVFVCSNCRMRFATKDSRRWNFCPNCGAEMQEG